MVDEVPAVGRGRAEAAEPVRRVDGHLIRQLRGQPADRAVLGPGQLVGLVRADQIGAADGAVQHGTAGEDRDRVPAVLAQDVREVTGRVPGGVHDGHGQGPGDDLVVIANGQAVEADLLGRRDDVRCPGLAGQRETAGDVVVMDVGLQHVRDPHPTGLRGGQNPADVTLRVDHDSLGPVVDQVAAIAQGGRLDGHDLRHVVAAPFKSQSRPRVAMSRRAAAPPVSMAASSAAGTFRSAARSRRISSAPYRLAS